MHKQTIDAVKKVDLPRGPCRKVRGGRVIPAWARLGPWLKRGQAAFDRVIIN